MFGALTLGDVVLLQLYDSTVCATVKFSLIHSHPHIMILQFNTQEKIDLFLALCLLPAMVCLCTSLNPNSGYFRSRILSRSKIK